MQIKCINPATESCFKVYETLSLKEISTKIEASFQAFLSWRSTSFSYRKNCFIRLAQKLRAHKEKYAYLMAQEMGKPIKLGVLEIEKCAWVCEHFAQNARHYLKNRVIKTEMHRTYVTHQPLGVIFAIMPWNYPFWQVFRYAAPHLMAGNVSLLKHAPICTGSGVAIEDLFREAGFPMNVFQHLIVDNKGAKSIIEHAKVAGVTLTGSEQTGRIIASLAGQNLKKCVIELGGNDPYIVLPDADLDNAVGCIVKSRLSNTGQVCIAAKRIIAFEEQVEPLVDKLIEASHSYKMGDPINPETNFGPMAREDLRDTLHKQVQESIEKGAKCVLGGKIPHKKGYYYPATILTNVRPGMAAFDEELFGPVISVVPVQDEKEAILLANKSCYGLGGGVFTEDLEKGEQLAKQLEVGACFVNTFVSSDPRVPFGGVKCSGFGRELSQEGILEFVNTKTIAIA